MVKKFLITRPNYDLNTSYLHYFSKNIVEVVKEKKEIHVTNLEGNKANRININNSLKKENAKLVFLNGHGTKNNVWGHNGEIILDKENIRLTKNKIVYALSCDSLKDLGPIAIKEGAKAYIGYSGRFMIVRDPTRTSSPSKDKNAKPFKKVCSILINSLVFSKTVNTSINLTKQEYIRLIKSYGNSEEDPYGDAPLIRFALTWDYEFLGMCGDGNAYF